MAEHDDPNDTSGAIDPDPAETKCGCPESLKLRAALARVMEVTGTSTLQYHIAREALE
jgi:hypothetical protein